MKPSKFDQANCLLAKNQDEYLELPAYVDYNDPFRCYTSCWKLSWKEWFEVLWTGRIYLTMMTMQKRPMPVKLETSFDAARVGVVTTREGQ